MPRLIYFLYNLLGVPALRLGFFILSRFNQKAKLGYQGRKVQRKTLSQTIQNISKDRKRILVHCTSVGEYEQAVPIIDLLKRQQPNLFVVVSFFSSSGYNFVKKNENIDLKIYLPLDVYSSAYKLLDVLIPSLFIISKFDVWPNYMVAAGKLNIPTVMIAATLSSNSKRDKGVSKWLNTYAFKHFDFIFPIAEEDRNRFLTLFPYPDRMEVTGDTRFDQVYKKGQKILKEPSVELFEDNTGLTMICGSIWPADEKHLLPALIKLLNKYDDIKLILVPHELHEEHIASIEEILTQAGIRSERYTELGDNMKSAQSVIIVNTIGMLAKLYVNTDLAYVGGSFSTGVHNVMEPAVFGQPVIFGPVYVNSFEAMELQKIESAFTGSNAQELEELFNIFVSDDGKRGQAGMAAKNLIERNIGATDKIIEILNQRYGDIKPDSNPRAN
ncbi:MAG: glycosyltransferase N-terminal domain-containing protein [Bacteroidota bacterium]